MVCVGILAYNPPLCPTRFDYQRTRQEDEKKWKRTGMHACFSRRRFDGTHEAIGGGWGFGLCCVVCELRCVGSIGIGGVVGEL